MSAQSVRHALLAAVIAAGFTAPAAAQPPPAWVHKMPAPAVKVDKAPRKMATEIGTLRMMTPESREAVFRRIAADKVYDLSVQYFIGLPSWYSDDDLPPIVARAVLIDVLGQKKVASLPPDYRITRADLEAALAAERASLKPGDIVLIRGGKITLDAAEWLAEANGAMLIGGDDLSLETYEYGRPDLTVPVHNYLLRQRGVAIIQVDNLDELAKEGVFEFAFIAASLRTHGDAVQFRPLAFPLQR
jgi:kynurenine formamidase